MRSRACDRRCRDALTVFTVTNSDCAISRFVLPRAASVATLSSLAVSESGPESRARRGRVLEAISSARASEASAVAPARSASSSAAFRWSRATVGLPRRRSSAQGDAVPGPTRAGSARPPAPRRPRLAGRTPRTRPATQRHAERPRRPHSRASPTSSSASGRAASTRPPRNMPSAATERHGITDGLRAPQRSCRSPHASRSATPSSSRPVAILSVRGRQAPGRTSRDRESPPRAPPASARPPRAPRSMSAETRNARAAGMPRPHPSTRPPRPQPGRPPPPAGAHRAGRTLRAEARGDREAERRPAVASLRDHRVERVPGLVEPLGERQRVDAVRTVASSGPSTSSRRPPSRPR